MLTFLAWFISQADPTDIPSWVLQGFGYPFMAGIIWILHKERNRADDRAWDSVNKVATVHQETSAQLYAAIDALKDQQQILGKLYSERRSHESG